MLSGTIHAQLKESATQYRIANTAKYTAGSSLMSEFH